MLLYNYYCRFVNGVYEFGYAEGHRGSIAEVAGKVRMTTLFYMDLVSI